MKLLKDTYTLTEIDRSLNFLRTAKEIKAFWQIPVYPEFPEKQILTYLTPVAAISQLEFIFSVVLCYFNKFTKNQYYLS